MSAKRETIIWISGVLMIVIMILSFVSCGNSPRHMYPITIENQTSQILSIYEGGVRVFDIEPGKDETVPLFRRFEWHIIAKNAQGEVVYSQVLKPAQIPEEPSPYIIVIPPLEE